MNVETEGQNDNEGDAMAVYNLRSVYLQPNVDVEKEGTLYNEHDDVDDS